MTITIKDIAREANVSYSTVSKALNDSPLVKPKTKEKILDIAKQLGYSPNYAAKHLVSKKSKTIGIIWPAIDRVVLSTLVTSINEILAKKEYDMILSVNSAVNAVKMFQSFRVDGIILFEDGKETQLLLDINMIDKIPILSYGVPDEDLPYPFIDVRHRKAIQNAVSYLSSLGHKEIAYIGDLSEFDKRQMEKLGGYQDGMNEANLPISESMIINTNGHGYFDGYVAANKLFKQTSLPTAIIGGSYELSVGILRAAKEMDIKIPETISIISYDNIPQMESLETGLTSTGVPLDTIALEMAEFLINLIENPHSKHLIKKLEPKLEIRESCSGISNKETDTTVS